MLNIDNIFPDFTAELLKGGKPAALGEIRTFGNKKYQKTSNGWRPVTKKDGIKQLNDIFNDVDENWSDEDFMNDKKIKDLYQKLASVIIKNNITEKEFQTNIPKWFDGLSFSDVMQYTSKKIKDKQEVPKSNTKIETSKKENISKVPSGNKVGFEDDFVEIYNNEGKKVYSGILDDCPYKDENYKWNDKDKNYDLPHGYKMVGK